MRVLSPVELFNLPLHENPFVVDCRSPPAHQASRVASSFRYPYEGSIVDEQSLAQFWVEVSDEWGLENMTDWILVDDLADAASVALRDRLDEALRNCPDLSGGTRAQPVKATSVSVVHFAAFAERYPFFFGPSASLDALAPSYPTEITPHLYLSGKGPACHERVMTDLGITHIVNAASFGERNHFEGDASLGIEYLRLTIIDDESQVLTDAFDQALPFMQEARANGGRVLVHCNQGINRSAAMIVAHLTTAPEQIKSTYHCDLQGALQHVRACRHPTSCLTNQFFVRQLEELEAAASASVPIAPKKRKRVDKRKS